MQIRYFLSFILLFFTDSAPLSDEEKQVISKGLIAESVDNFQILKEDKPQGPFSPKSSYINIGGANGGDCFKDFPHLQNRFNFEQLEFFCQQQRQFNKAVFGNETVNPFTEDQKKYLESLKMDLNREADEMKPISIRKEIRHLTDEERRLFGFALRSLKRSIIDGVSKYDLIVVLHHPSLAPGSYVGAAFLPWHREYLRTFETALKQENPYVSVPYWDSTLDSRLPDPRDSLVWHPRFFGNRYGPIVAGPFARAEFVGPNSTESIPVFRNVTLADEAHPFRESDVKFVMDTENYREMTACRSIRLEQASRAVHTFVGGSMADVYYSPQDFLFFLHHAFMDKLWQDWMDLADDVQILYPPNPEACTEWHYASSPMLPFAPLRNVDGMSHVYMQYYAYEDSHSHCEITEDCNSDYLFCGPDSQCMSKIMVGGNCTTLHDTEGPCYNSECSVETDLCVKRPPPKIILEEVAQADGSGE